MKKFLSILLTLSVLAIFSTTIQAQETYQHGTVVALQGTPHLWFADEQGVLHMGRRYPRPGRTPHHLE